MTFHVDEATRTVMVTTPEDVALVESCYVEGVPYAIVASMFAEELLGRPVEKHPDWCFGATTKEVAAMFHALSGEEYETVAYTIGDPSSVRSYS